LDEPLLLSVEYPKENLVAAYGPPVRIIKEVRPIEILGKENDRYIVDMGQNMVGWIRFKVRGKPGTELVLKHAEVLDKEGNLYTENLRSARQEVKYICRGGGEEVFEPHFTFQGFRFVEISGWPGELGKEMLSGMVIHSDMPVTGSFSCSDSLINQLQHNIVWGLKGNFLDVPTDCPQRDERLGWTGDAQVFAPTACFNVDAAAFYTKWLKDLALDQDEEGKVNDVIPDVLNGGGGHTGWADAAVIIPWTVYLNYGDTRILEEQYESMKAWVGYMRKRAGEDFIWDGDWHYGDWLSFDDDHPAYMGAYTETDLIATAYFAYSATLLGRIAAILDNDEDAVYYDNLSRQIRKAFRHEFVTPAGRLVSNTQTAYTLALAFDLLPNELREQTAEYLYHNVNRFKHITTGFLGTPLICKTLTDNGYAEIAYFLLNRKEYPSWLYPVTMGATTIWERWDGIKPDTTFQNPGMNSLNHYAYGAIGQWLYSYVAGIKIDEKQPGLKNMLIEPLPGGGLTEARASLKTMYGSAFSSWKQKDDTILLKVTIPANSTAEVVFPAPGIESVHFHGKPVGKQAGFPETGFVFVGRRGNLAPRWKHSCSSGTSATAAPANPDCARST
jgi:alpha-L-rhamnosidase